MGALFKGKVVIVDFLNHLDQSIFVYEGMQKPAMEMSRDELENAYMLQYQLAEFWKLKYNELYVREMK
jgi:hypothetical protein